MLGVSWVIACRTLGGWLYLTMKLMSMISWTLFCYGGAVAFGGYYMATKDLSTEFDPTASELYTTTCAAGVLLMLVSSGACAGTIIVGLRAA